MLDYRVSNHFWLREFHCYDRRHSPITLFEEYPDKFIQDGTLATLCQLLEEIRAIWNFPVEINSAYRALVYNRLIGSTDGSQHPLGRATDITVKGVRPSVVQDTLLRRKNTGLLANLHGLGSYPTFTHVDIRLNDGRLARWGGSRTIT